MQVYGHMDYGKQRSVAGLAHDRRVAVDGRRQAPGPAQRPVRSTSGASAWKRLRATRAAPRSSRGGDTNGPASVYAHRQVGSSGSGSTRLRARPTTTSTEVAAGAQPGQRRPADLLVHGLHGPDWSSPRPDGNNTVDDEGTPQWRMAPSPHGPYWKEGMKLGYQDAGSWTMLEVDARSTAARPPGSTPSSPCRRRSTLKKIHRRPDASIRDVDHRAEIVHRSAPKLGGLVEFYRSPDRVKLDADRHQRARLSEAGAALVAADR